MAKHTESASDHFTCSCQEEPIPKHNILDHLKLKSSHNIRKIVPQSLKILKNSILDKIENIAKTRIQIQASSNQLIQTISQNTSVIIQKLSNIINLFRHLILNPPKVNLIKNFEIVNTFKATLPLNTALYQHFEQQPFAQSTIGAISRKAKTQIIEIKRNHEGNMKCMAVFSDEKRVVTGGDDGAIRVWDLEINSQIWFILKHKDTINSLALGKSEDLVLTASGDTTVRFWNIKFKFQIHKFIGHTLSVTSVLFSKDQRTGFSGSFDQTIRTWDLNLLAPQKTFSFKTSIWKICLIREEKTIVASQKNGSVSFFNLKDNRHLKTPSYHNFKIKSICFTPDEKLFITGSENGTVEVWLTNVFKRHFFQKKHSAEITSIQISTCSKLFATGSLDYTVIVWDFIKLRTIRIIQNQSKVNSLQFVKSSSSLLICYSFEISCCSLSTFVNQQKIKTKPLNSIAISPNFKYAAYGNFHVYLFDIDNKKVEKRSNIKQNIFCLNFSSNSAFVAVGCFGGEIAILSIPNLVQLYTLYTYLSIIHFISFSKSNELIGFSDGRTSVKVMSIKTKEMLYKNENERRVVSVCFCLNDERFIYSDGDSVHVLSKKFSFLTKISFSFGVGVRELFVNEDGSYILVNHSDIRCSILKAESLEKIFEEKRRKIVKEWCAIRQEIIFRTILSL